MPVLDTPITTDDKNLKKVLGQKQPAILLLHDGRNTDKPLDDALKRVAKKNAGDLLVVKVDVSENPKSHQKYDQPSTPALITMSKSFFGRKVLSQAEEVRPADVRAHVDFLLNDKPLPEDKPKAEAKSKGKKPIAVFDDSFRQEVLKSKKPVLVDFWAPWCGPCRNIAPYVDKMAKEYGDKIKVVKVNTDASPIMSRRYQVQSLPTFMMFDGGQPVNRISGASPPAIKSIIEQAIR